MKTFSILIFCSFTSLILSAQQTNVSLSETFKNYVGASSGGGNGSMVNLTIKDETEGSPYLFTKWASGIIHTRSGNTYTEPSHSLNYDKVQNKLIVNMGGNRIMSLDMNDIDLFTLKNDSTTYNFERFAAIPGAYNIVVYKGPAYSLYKSITTKFYASDYQNKGLYEKGYKYDRYVDSYDYFIVSNDGQTIELKNGSKRELKKAGEKIPALLNFLSKNNYTPGESYLKSAIVFINKG